MIPRRMALAKKPGTRGSTIVRVLVIDDDPELRDLVKNILPHGYDVIEADDAASGIQAADTADPDVILLDINLGEGPDGFKVLDHLSHRELELPVVILSSYQDTDTIVRAMKAGATHYISKPPRQDELVERLRIAMTDRQRAYALASHRMPGQPVIVGNSQSIREVIHLARAAQNSDLPVLILGETGTGKGLVARCIHEWGERKNAAYRDVNVAGLPTSILDSELFGHERGAFTGAEKRRRGLFELTSGGTLLLDEIGDLPSECQVKLLKVVEEGSFRRVGGEEDLKTDVRVLAATHRNLEGMIGQDTFRQDLYHRLAGLVIRVPPLREHPEDIPAMASEFLGEDITLSSDALELLQGHQWPGNVRELHQVLRRAALFVRDGTIQVDDFHLEQMRSAPLAGEAFHDDHLLDMPFNDATKEASNRFRKTYLERLLGRCGGNVSRAARECGVSRPHLHTMIRNLGLTKLTTTSEE